jgi:hypothetical protein
MPLYVTVSGGPSADQARPILASSDRSVVAAVFAALRSLGEHSDGPANHEPTHGDTWPMRPDEEVADAVA